MFTLKTCQNLDFKQKLQNLRAKQCIYKTKIFQKNIPMSLTFNDVLMIPQYSQINSRSQCKIQSLFSQNVPLKIPIVSSPMDTVTQSRMAIQMARNGGLGIIHRFMPIQQQVVQIQKVKRAGVFINSNPVTVQQSSTFKQIKMMQQKYSISTFLVIQKLQSNQSPRIKQSKRQIKGIITARDISCFEFDQQLVKNFMTPVDRLVYYQVQTDFSSVHCDLNLLLSQCKALLYKHKIQKIPILNSKKEILGLVSLKDIHQYEKKNLANKDHTGRLYVGGAVGANKDYLQRARALSEAGCDVLVVDVANGHSKLAMNATEQLKDQFPTLDVVSGSIATGEGAQNLIRCGADGIRCGIGNGSICITRVVSGCGVPQFTALMDTVPVCVQYGVPLCSDGGNKNSGNMCKALAIGANSIMVGRLVAGCDQSPGIAFNRDGKFIKIYRGMAGLGANLSKQEKTGGDHLNPQTFSPEGVQGFIPYTGPLEYVLQGFASGIKSGMSYCGSFNLQELVKKTKFIQITNSGFKQSEVHGISKFQ